MNIKFTNKAKEKIREKLGENDDEQLKLVYDTIGCGCVNDGVIYLAAVHHAEPDDIEIKTNDKTVYIEAQFQIYYEEDMTIDYSETYQCFQLKSPNQIINPRMKFVKS
ncbi:iron-sulfur cluster biosynthesis family protein [Scopulibacillus cellulosilyticus]|uniref:Iron-sulfur cluster biosynthesis family protein n=1 Tax=Scopulibacillus cellulosilyticus TaxID=2665665 RepID=A0ABW2PPQ8_9BACL